MAEVQQADKKWWAKALLVGAVVGFVCLPLGALGTKAGIWGFEGGFMLLAVGVVLATAVFFLGLIALVFTVVRKMDAERGSVAIGVVIAAVILGLMGSQFMTASSVPPIHNISTDTSKLYQPDWVRLDRHVLRFYGFFKETVVESNSENARNRKVKVLFYLEDNSISINEEKK